MRLVRYHTPALVAFICVLHIVVGCEGKPVLTGPQAAALIRNVELGMSRADVVATLGEPPQQWTHGNTEFLFYYVDWINKAAAQERTPVCLVNGRVVATGRAHYEEFLKVRGIPIPM